jgi:hypothetical protein
MKGDFTRVTFRPGKHYSAVRMQQGRVQMDADWNEQLDIQAHRERTGMTDVIGPCGVPQGTGGFRIAPIDADASGHGEVLAIAPGRIYVDGILCELQPSEQVTLVGAGGSGGLSHWLVDSGPTLRAQQWLRLVGGAGDGTLIQVQGLTPPDPEAEDQRVQVDFAAADLAPASDATQTVEPLATYQVQPDYPNPPEVGTGSWMAYLDVWERHITALDDPLIREVALNGPDTATRLRTVWQVKLQALADAEAGCDDFVGWAPAGGRLAARGEPGGDDGNPCIIPAEAGYRRLENQLYRVEIHDDGSDGGTPTFKWSRDNGSLVVRLVSVDTANNAIVVSHPRSDPLTQFATDDWVEVLDEDMILDGTPGIFIQVGEISGNELGIQLNPSGATLPTSGFVRRWEGGPPVEVDTGGWIPLESGVEIRFDATDYHRGDYWTIPARSVTHDVEWPGDPSSGAPLFLDPQGVVHHTCPLGILEHHADGDWSLESDCREEFPPLTDLSLGGCCLRVDPGDDLQQAIDHVVGHQGGCICLGAGVHEHVGMLRIQGADKLTLYGEGQATVLRLLPGDGADDGGLVVMDSQNVNLERMSLLGIGIDAVVRTHGGFEMPSSRRIRLRDLAVLNATIGDQERPTQAAVRLSNCSDITIGNCALIGENGLVCTLWDELPTLASLDLSPIGLKGGGVRRLRMHNASLHYGHCGVWSLRSERWDLDTCEMRAIRRTGLAQQINRLIGADSEQLVQVLPEALDMLLGAEGLTAGGTAIKAFIWDGCTLHDCLIRSGRGLEVWCYLRSRLTGCLLETGEAGVHADWLHDSSTDNNAFSSGAGDSIRFVGSYRARIVDNHIRTGTGITNLAWQARLFDFLDYVEQVAALYPALEFGDEFGDEDTQVLKQWLAFWVLLHETIKLLGLWQLISAALDAFGTPQIKHVLYNMFAGMVYFWLLDYRERVLDDGELNEVGLAALALNVSGNDIESARGCVRLERLLLMGGARVAGNRLNNQAGRAVQLDAQRMFENVHLVNALWRFVFQEMIDNRIPAWIDNLQASGAVAWVPMMEELLELMQTWSDASEHFLEADFRIDGNSIRSQGTAVASNLWELAVERNHITMREQANRVDDGIVVIEALAGFMATRGMAHAVRNGTHEGVRYAFNDLSDAAVINNDTMRREVAEAMFMISARATNPDLRDHASALGAAMNDADAAAVGEHVDTMVEAIASGTDSHGILLRNPGCRVSDNHVLVPLDVDPNSWARGGITVSTVGGEDEQGLGSMELLAILALMGFAPASDPVVGVTETRIAGNEVIGGFGHGIHIDTPIVLGSGQAELPWGLFDIAVSGNQVRGMGGAGVVVSEETYAVGVEIAGNQIIDCSSRLMMAGFTTAKGGLVITNAGGCRVRDNRVVRCANGLPITAYGIILDTILGAEIHANQLLSNGSQISESTGGLLIRTLVDGGTIHDNGFDRNRGIELRLDNAYDIKEIPSELVDLVNFYAARADSGDLRYSAVSIQDNRIHARHRVSEVHSVDELTFAGNQVVMALPIPAFFFKIDTGIVSHNRVRVPAEETVYSLDIRLNRGTVVGNLTDLPIVVRTSAPANLEHGLNIPKIDHGIV